MSASKFISLADAAERYDVNPETIRRRIADGTIPGYQLKGSPRVVRIKVDDLESLFPRIPVGGAA